MSRLTTRRRGQGLVTVWGSEQGRTAKLNKRTRPGRSGRLFLLSAHSSGDKRCNANAELYALTEARARNDEAGRSRSIGRWYKAGEGEGGGTNDTVTRDTDPGVVLTRSDTGDVVVPAEARTEGHQPTGVHATESRLLAVLWGRTLRGPRALS